MWVQSSEQHTGPWRHKCHIQRPDTRPIEAQQKCRKISLQNLGHPHTPQGLPATLNLTKDQGYGKEEDIKSHRVDFLDTCPKVLSHREALYPHVSVMVTGGNPMPAGSARHSSPVDAAIASVKVPVLIMSLAAKGDPQCEVR